MGMKEAFTHDADLSNITGDKTLFVGDAIHKADIEFSEDGIRAAAVTAMMILEKAAFFEETNPVNITIDKPFMFVIRAGSYNINVNILYLTNSSNIIKSFFKG